MPTHRAEPARSAPRPNTCARAISDLRTWLEALRGEGRSEALFYGDHFELATVPAPSNKLSDADVVTAYVAGEIRILGERVARGDEAGDVIGKNVREVVDRYRQKWSRPLTSALLIIDQSVAWPVVVKTSAALAGAGVVRQHFLAHAGQTLVPPPPPSSLDAKFDAENRAIEAASGAIVASEVSFKDLVFGGCPPALDWVRSVNPYDEDPDRERTLVSEIPARVAACGCAVEIPAVQRLFWYWWHRDATGAPHVVLSVDISPQGTPLRAGTSVQWAKMATEILHVARAGAPVRLVVDR